MMYKMEYYSAAKTAWKFAKACGVFGSGAAASAVFPDESASIEQWATFLALCLPPLITAARNFWKHRDKIGGKVSYALPFLLLVSLAGCGTLPGGALAGKTHYNVEFSDTTAEQDTRYRMNIKAPAGVDLASVTGMTYDWNPDGSGKISVSQDQATDTRAQADALVQSTAASMSAMAETMKIIAPLAQSAVSEIMKFIAPSGQVRALEKLPPLTLRGATP